MNGKTNKNTPFNYELFFELSPDLLCIAGYDGFFKKINSSVSKLLGYTMEELYARPINEFVYHEDQPTTRKVREQLIKRTPLLNFENRYVTKSGEIVWLSWTSLPVDDDQLIFAIAKNITHQKRMEAERNALVANLTKGNKELKELTYTTSHDLRAPVNNLLSIFSLINTAKIDDSETLEFLEILKMAGESLKQTVNNYVDILSERDAIHANIEELCFKECVEAVLRSISTLVINSSATINYCFDEVEKVLFNKAYMESIFLNLITNAIKYSKPGYRPVINLSTTKQNGITQLIISDNGLGFEMEQVKDQIFGLHQKFHNHIDSKGIGLYLVYNHINNLGGKIAVESKVNAGTTFTISFKP